MKTLLALIQSASALALLASVVDAAEPPHDRATTSTTGSFQATPDALPADRTQENSVEFSVNEAGSTNDRRDGVAGRAHSTQVRAERRAMIARSHADLAEALELDAQTAEAVIELVTNDQMARLQQVADPSFADTVEARAQAETNHLDALRALLGGDEGLAKYRDYIATSAERAQVRALNAMLGPEDKLQAEQKRRLVALHAEQNRSVRGDIQPRNWGVRPLTTLPNPAEMQRISQLSTIAVNEDILRRMEKSNPDYEQRAAEFLTARQLAVLTHMNRQQTDSLRAWVENARRAAGLNPAIPEEPETDLLPPPAPERVAISGPVTFDIEVSIDGSGTQTFSNTVENGRAFELRASEDLWIEATPILYDDYWLAVRLNYLEQAATGRVRLDDETLFGSLTKLPDETAGGGALTNDVVTGRKAYAVRVLVKAQPRR